MNEQQQIQQEQKQCLVDSLISEWELMKASFTREELEDDCGNSGIDIRLQLLNDELELHTGDAQYDTNHQGYWGETTLDYDWDEEEIFNLVTEAVEFLVSGIEDWLEMDKIHERIIDQRIDDMIDNKSLSKAD